MHSSQPAAVVSRPRVLVLLAAYNGSQWIGQQLESILAQEGVDLRIVVRDDGSTDSTRREVERFAADVRVKIAFATAPTGSAAQNFLALIRENRATGFDFVAFADQDDTWYRNKLMRACSALTIDGSAGYSSATMATWADGTARLLTQARIPGFSDFLFEGAGQGCTFVLSVDFYGRMREFVSKHHDLTRALHYHDWSVYALARAWDMPWRFDSEPSMIYRQHTGNDTGARNTIGGVFKRLSLLRKGWYRTQLFGIAELCAVAAPDNITVGAWRAALLTRAGWHRKLHMARFCLRGGRRRALDNTVIILATLAGWI